MRNLVKIAFIVILFMGISCTKEDPIPVDASFTTNINNNTLETGEGFMVYLYDASGEFLTYYKGNNDENTYKPDRNINKGVALSANTDSVQISGYNAPGTYTFAVLAASSGNWAEDYEYDVDSISITVVEP